MRKTLLFLCLLAGYQISFGQDTITLRNGKHLLVSVTERDLKVVKYRMPDYPEGPVITLKGNTIRKICYRNGETDMMGYQNPRKAMPLGVSLGYAAEVTSGGSLVLGSVDYFVLPQIDLVASLGTSDMSGRFYYAGGPVFYFNQKLSERRLAPFAGVLGGEYYGDAFVQVPVGVTCITRKGISASLSVNEMVSFASWTATFIELKVGWRFRL
jgi:hypothetical protein